MILIKKWRVRLLVCLLLAGIITETTIIQTNGEVQLNTFIIGIVFYFVLSMLLWVLNYYMIKRKVEKDLDL